MNFSVSLTTADIDSGVALTETLNKHNEINQ